MNASISVNLEDRSYRIVIGPGLLAEAGRLMLPVLDEHRVVVLTDGNVAGLHLDSLTRALDTAGIGHQTIVLPAGEGTKSLGELGALLERLLDLRIERGTTIVACGGGVVGDVAGFAASVVLRGVGYVQAPTTLLAQVDSSVGGKTGINTRHGKNLVGTFYQPRLVLADTGVLDTLPTRQLLAGYAEIVKYGVIADRDFFAWLERNGESAIAGDQQARIRAIERSCRMKAEVVGEDERESGRRAILNLGHTFAHALEAETAYGESLLHGEAVAAGMCLATELSVRLGMCANDELSRLRHHLSAVGLPTGLPPHPKGRWDAGRLLDLMRSDKKVRGGQPTFILVRGIGTACVAHDVPLDVVRGVLTDAAAAA